MTRRGREITWQIAGGFLELAIVVYILTAIPERNTSLIVGVLGILYATIRHIGLGVAQQLHELKRLWDPEALPINETKIMMSRYRTDVAIASLFLTLVAVICLLHVFSKL